MTYYDAKFAREAKQHPADWIILPDGRLHYIGRPA